MSVVAEPAANTGSKTASVDQRGPAVALTDGVADDAWRTVARGRGCCAVLVEVPSVSTSISESVKPSTVPPPPLSTQERRVVLCLTRANAVDAAARLRRLHLRRGRTNHT